MYKSGLFISIEGLDGSGKTTIQAFLNEWFKELILSKKINFNDVITTREPGGKNNIFCEQLRSLILNNNLDNKTEILLYAASRIEHVKNTIIPNLKLNNIVISDRFIDSSLVYQGFANQIDINKIFEINIWGVENTIPHFTLYLDIDPSKARLRALERKIINKYDEKPIQYYENIKNGFDFITNQFKDRFIKIDANQSELKMQEEIKDKLWKKLLEMKIIRQ